MYKVTEIFLLTMFRKKYFFNNNKILKTSLTILFFVLKSLPENKKDIYYDIPFNPHRQRSPTFSPQ